jgi:opacity protein-like surface antigen
MRFRVTPSLLVVFSLVSATGALAQQVAPLELTIIPGGATFFVEASDSSEPSFTNYDLGVALAANFNRYVGIEGEFSTSIGLTQNLAFATFEREAKTPSLLHYTGNVVVSVPTGSSVTPFVTGGAGGLTIFDRADIIQRNRTFLAGNVGGGVKWYAGRWGLRADYRFLLIRGRDIPPSAPDERLRPDFFGKETRYGHRVFGGIILNIG